MKQRHIAIRSCVVCRQTSDKRTLLRVVRLPEAEGVGVVSDPTGKRAGRGAYVCATMECIDKAQKTKKFERSLSVPAGTCSQELFDVLRGLAANNTDDVNTSRRSNTPMK